MQGPIQFVPKASPFLQQRWGALLIVFVLLVLFLGLEIHEVVWFTLIAIVITTVATLKNKWVYRLTVFPATSTLEYIYINIWGIRKTVIVDLTTAGGSYKFEIFSKTAAGWRLLLYNKHYFDNRVSIKQDDKAGFSKAQLDEIAALVRKCRKG